MRSPNGQLERQVFRGIAILFLLYTGADLLNPQLCAEDRGLVALHSIASRSVETQPLAYASHLQQDAKDSENNQSPDQPPQDEDCFCCCAHVVPGVVFVPPIVLQQKLVIAMQEESSTSRSNLETPYHPPRFS